MCHNGLPETLSHVRVLSDSWRAAFAPMIKIQTIGNPDASGFRGFMRL
jgi:hypothetical protein